MTRTVRVDSGYEHTYLIYTAYNKEHSCWHRPGATSHNMATNNNASGIVTPDTPLAFLSADIGMQLEASRYLYIASLAVSLFNRCPLLKISEIVHAGIPLGSPV
jgi:hypothetical protein